MICNYTESNKPSLPVGIINYIDAVTSQDEWYINQQKRIRRDKNISDLLGEETEALESDWSSFSGGGEIQVISPKLISLTVKGVDFTSYEDLREDILQYLDKLTSSPMYGTLNNRSIDIQIKKDPLFSNRENIQMIGRRILTKITFCSNIIAMNGRLGPANTVIVGNDLFEYLSELDNSIRMLNGINIIKSDKIKPNKCIILRGSSQLSPGLCLVKHDDRYFMKETPNYEKTIAWFELV